MGEMVGPCPGCPGCLGQGGVGVVATDMEVMSQTEPQPRLAWGVCVRLGMP
jgi:hypothetical protein